jgi:hypothetical protein
MFTTKQYAVGLITGDFNGDGKKDLITGEGQVYLGQGNGKFTQLGQSIFQSIDYGNLRYTFAVGDFNHDGKIDLAAANGGSVTICLGNGDGAFTLGATYLTNGNADLLATDLDGDGNLDLYAGLANGGIFSGDYPGIVSLGSGYALMGKGDGTFSGVAVLPFTFTFPGETVSSAGSFGPLSGPGNVVDLNKDGKLDVLSTEGALDANNRPVFALVGYLGRGDGTFMTGPSTGILSPDLNSFAIADFNGDGLPDVAYLVGTGYYVAFGNGDGSFKPGIFTAAPSFYSNQQDYGESLTNLTSADFNHDGKADLMYFVHDSNFSAKGPINVIAEAAIQLGNGDGTFRAPILVPLSGGNSPYTSQAYTLPSLIGDVSGDGIPDLLVLQYTGVSYPILSNTDYGTQLAVYLGNGDGTFKAPLIAQTAENPTVQLLADMNGDGKLDLVALGDHYGVNYLNSSSELAVSLGNGNGTFQMPVIYAEKFDASGRYSGNLESENLLAADFNGDGKMDLLNGGSVYLGNGDGTLQITSGTEPTQILEVGSDYGFVYAGDFNNDGKPDLLWSNVLLLNEYPGKSSGGGGPVLLSNLTITSQGPVYNRGTKLFSVTVTLTNNTAAAVSGPIEVAFNNLPAGVTLTDSAGNSPAGAPFLSVASGLAVGASATFGAQFSDPSNTPIPISLSIYSGSF